MFPRIRQLTFHRLAAVYEANQIISSERDLGRLFERVLDQIFALVPAHSGVILLKDEKTSELVTEFVRSREQQAEVPISSTIVNRAYRHEEAVITTDAAIDARFGAVLKKLDLPQVDEIMAADVNRGEIYATGTDGRIIRLVPRVSRP